MIPLKPVSGPAVWYADDLIRRPEEWKLQLGDEHIAELEAAVDSVIESRQTLEVGISRRIRTYAPLHARLRSKPLQTVFFPTWPTL